MLCLDSKNGLVRGYRLPDLQPSVILKSPPILPRSMIVGKRLQFTDWAAVCKFTRIGFSTISGGIPKVNV